jgi:hypothetical protein
VPISGWQSSLARKQETASYPPPAEDNEPREPESRQERRFWTPDELLTGNTDE